MLRSLMAAALLAVSLLPAALARAQGEWRPPQDIAYRQTTVWSEGIPLAAQVFQHRAHAGQRRPTVVLCHGWGGEAAGLRRQAIAFATAGYTVITFDYRGWGESSGRLIVNGTPPPRRDGKPFTAEVIELREVIQPWERIQDIVSVVAWAAGEPEVNVQRLGLWGASYGGGHVLFVAAYDARIKAVVAQAAAFDGRPAGQSVESWRAIGRLHGFPMLEQMLHYAPVEQAALVRPHEAVLIIAAEKEELFDNAEHGAKVHARLKGPRQYTVVPDISHYDVYTTAFDRVTRLATDWYDRHLK